MSHTTPLVVVLDRQGQVLYSNTAISTLVTVIWMHTGIRNRANDRTTDIDSKIFIQNRCMQSSLQLVPVTTHTNPTSIGPNGHHDKPHLSDNDQQTGGSYKEMVAWVSPKGTQRQDWSWRHLWKQGQYGSFVQSCSGKGWANSDIYSVTRKPQFWYFAKQALVFHVSRTISPSLHKVQ